MSRIFRAAGVAALVSLFLFLLVFAISVARIFHDSLALRLSTLAILAISLPVIVIIILGYLSLAETLKLPILARMAWLTLIMVFIGSIIDTLALFQSNGIITGFSLAITIISGVVFLSFGWVVLKLTEFGGLTKGLGIVYMIQGAALVSVVLVFIITPFTAIVTSILEALLFFQASERFSHEKKKMPKLRKRKS
jgi:hypothetical protein